MCTLRVSDACRDGLSTARPSIASQAGRSPRGTLTYAEGDYVWTPSASHGFRRSTIVSVQSDTLICETRDEDDPAGSGQFQVKRDEVRPFFDYGPDKTWSDNTSMVHLDDANILENLRRRYYQDDIYTYTANVLLAVNPYKMIPGLYSPETVAEYRGKPLGKLPPHPFAIADAAYRQLIRQKQNQALVISGESGAGKTETAKMTMHYITQASRTGAEAGGKIQEKIINSNPILESFGNASTVRNQNSSRFGKYNEMFFDPVGRLMYAGIRTYLLESSRVVGQQSGERNFHVFYEMLAGLDEDYLEETLQLDASGSYRLLHAGGAPSLVPGTHQALEEASKFKQLETAMSSFASPEECKEFWELLAALVHLGEVQFVDVAGSTTGDTTPVSRARQSGSADGSPSSQATADLGADIAKVQVHPESADALAQAAFLLGIQQVGQLEQALIFKEMNVRGSVIYCPRTLSQAIQTQQSIIKILYNRLFDKMVERINVTSSGKSTASPSDSPRREHHSIGTLDIYGFERLRTNSFEQLCINLANERLQQFFIEEVLEAEQRLYEEEGLRIQRFPLPDNKPVVAAIEATMAILDEHSLRSSKNLVREGGEADTEFCGHVHRNLVQGKRDSPIMALRMNSKAAREGTAMKATDGFQIRHYAGPVTYATRGWIDKNNDALVPEVESLLDDAKRELTRSMADRNRLHASSTRDSVSHKYLGNLSSLLQTLKKCSVHYIRCFNPNDKREAGVFLKNKVHDQVVQCGTVELVKIMHHGFPNRVLLSELRERFQNLLPSDFQRYKDAEFVEALMMAFELEPGEWTLGTKRLFLKAGQLLVLENLRDVGSTASQDLLKRLRLHFAKKKVWSIVAKAKVLRNWLRSNRRNRLRRIATAVSKAAFIFVRVMRWWNRTRTRLYPPQPEVLPEEQDVLVPSAAALPTVTEPPLPVRFLKPQVLLSYHATNRQIFVACNPYEQPKYTNLVASQMDMSKPIGETTLKMWQRDTTENILYHNRKEIFSARLDPKGFIVSSLVEAQNRKTGLDDIRVVDPHESGKAFPIRSIPRQHKPAIVCMCQSHSRREFATCDEDHKVTHWRWRGTDSMAPEKDSVKLLGGTPSLQVDEVLHMCFLSPDVLPDRVKANHGVTLVILFTRNGYLSLMLLSVYQGSHKVEDLRRVDLSDAVSDSEGLRSYDMSGNIQKVEINFMTTTHSEKLVVLGGGIVGGRAVLRLFAVRTSAAGKLSLEPVEDASTHDAPIEPYLPDEGVSITALFCGPPPVRCGNYDWLAFGDNRGTLYGFKLDHLANGSFQVDEGSSGRFRESLHTKGVAIRQIIGCFGTHADTHHREVQRAGIPYGSYLDMVPMRKDTFYSLGADGVLLTWNMTKPGWRHSWTCHFDAGDVVSAQCSRLVPNIMVRFEEGAFFKCFDTAQGRQARTGRTSSASAGGA